MLYTGQWQPIAGTVLAVLGSLYILLAADLDEVDGHANPGMPSKGNQFFSEGVGLGLSVFGASAQSIASPAATHTRHDSSDSNRQTLNTVPTTDPQSPNFIPIKRSWTIDQGTGKRREVAKTLTAIGNYLGTAKQGKR